MQISQAINCLQALSQFQRRLSFERYDDLTGYIIRIEGLTYEPDRKLVRELAKSLNLKITEDAEGISLM